MYAAATPTRRPAPNKLVDDPSAFSCHYFHDIQAEWSLHLTVPIPLTAQHVALVVSYLVQ